MVLVVLVVGIGVMVVAVVVAVVVVVVLVAVVAVLVVVAVVDGNDAADNDAGGVLVAGLMYQMLFNRKQTRFTGEAKATQQLEGHFLIRSHIDTTNVTQRASFLKNITGGKSTRRLRLDLRFRFRNACKGNEIYPTNGYRLRLRRIPRGIKFTRQLALHFVSEQYLQEQNNLSGKSLLDYRFRFRIIFTGGITSTRQLAARLSVPLQG